MSGKATKYVSPLALTPAQVVDLRQRHRDGYTVSHIAELFDLDVRVISRVASGESRKDVTTVIPPWTPLCMGFDEYQLWRDQRVGSNFTTTTPRPCDDCPLDYAAEHAALGLCNGIPGGIAEDDDDEDAA